MEEWKENMQPKGTYNINRYIDIIVVCDKIQSEFSGKIKVLSAFRNENCKVILLFSRFPVCLTTKLLKNNIYIIWSNIMTEKYIFSFFCHI